MPDLYNYLNTKKGKSYFEDQIKPFSLISLHPYIDTSRKLRGNSRTIGDAEKEVQDAIIDMLITISVRYGLNYKEISYILLTTKVESGFNPDAAAGTTSAGGLAQGTVDFIKDALTLSEDILGFPLDLRNDQIFDAEKGCYAVVYSFLLNKEKVMNNYTSDQKEYWEWLYLLHHDGAYSLGKYLEGTRKKSKDGKKWADYIMEHLSTVESLLKNTEVNTKFKLSTNDNTPIKNKEYIAVISPFPNSTCPKLISDYEKSLIFFKGITDANGMTDSVNTIAGTEIVFTILSDNYKKLAKTGVTEASNDNQTPLTYTVTKGDTLSGIAKKYGVSVEKTARINKIHNMNMLSIGTTLKIPDRNTNHGYTSRYVSEKTKKEILKGAGIVNANSKAAMEYSRSHIVLPKGSSSADTDKNDNIIHIKTTTTGKAISSRKSQQPDAHKTNENGVSKRVSVINDFIPEINFAVSDSLKKLVSEHSLQILREIMKSAGIHKIKITSTLRSVEKQVNAMYHNMRTKGIDSQLSYYARAGREVIKAAIDAGGNDPDKVSIVKQAMSDKVIELQVQGRLVSRHCVSKEMYAKRNVFDISKHISKKQSVLLAFDKALSKYASENEGFKYISPFVHSGEPAFHVEIEQ